MEIKDMTLQDVEERIAQLDAVSETTDNEEELSASIEERKALEDRRVELADLEQRKADAKALEENRAEGTVEVVEERKEIEKMKDIKEFRNSEEYVNAYAEYIKTGEDRELRALLTENVGAAGEIAVPDLVYDIVKTDWLKSGIMSLVKKISVKGNYRVQFELSAGDAVIHDEGSGAVSEEELTLGVVTLIPESLKKWISISDEALGLRGESFLRYIYDELTYRIALKAESELISKIAALPTTATDTSVCAKQVKAGAILGTIANALGQLNAEAANPVIVMNPSTKAAFKASVYAGQFNADPFEGLNVILTNNLPAFSTASENDVYAIVGDFGFGALANFPEGDQVTIKVDDKTDMTKDLVRILGREYVAVEPIACRAFVNITKPAAV